MSIDPNPSDVRPSDFFGLANHPHQRDARARVGGDHRPEHLAKWARSKASMDRLEVGGSGMWTFERYGEVPIEIEAYDPPRSITYRWGHPSSPLIDPVVSTVVHVHH